VYVASAGAPSSTKFVESVIGAVLTFAPSRYTSNAMSSGS
jgi:hypothetical protein